MFICRSSAKNFWPALARAGLALDLDLAHQPDAVGVDPLERELLGVPAGHDLRRAASRAASSSSKRARAGRMSRNTHDGSVYLSLRGLDTARCRRHAAISRARSGPTM